MRGRLITIEGVEGVGKSTNIELIGSLVREAGHDVIVTREPGGTEVGEKIRQILLDKDQTQMTATTELLLMFASRSQHVEEVIKPALAAGTWVISDRFTDSSYAYQGAGRGLGFEKVRAAEMLAMGEFEPDLTLLLDLDVQTGLARAASVSEADRFESEAVNFFESVRGAFKARAAEHDRFVVIDAAQPLNEVKSCVASAVDRLLKESD